MLALLGGTFNPPHLGHIHAVRYAARECNIKKVGLMPCKLSPLKTQLPVSDEHRINMLDILCTHYSDNDVTLYVEALELHLPSPSFTVNTLRAIREKLGSDVSLSFFLGDDSLYTLDKWREWESLLNYCHLIVMPRPTPHAHFSNAVQSWLSEHGVKEAGALHQQACGFVYRCSSPPLSVSSSALRAAMTEAPGDKSKWLPSQVQSYIAEHQLYRKI
ncbi:nicotinate (nicotinamide) nucleotide adenylyltransferase [Alteromonas sediminis]|uniref:Probable nicotinate-nucleotide adenylyltransferase n=1 Tax=Alteromonas sediminis TaxID=2259342 RepID=A0A3N5ZBN1_9ALTE|nr:nicotinate (nicotinamide) nucleotide adenylyltransferase [Alteromonas sediminis]RPJ68784.1 nicotinate (nicotinamide) nucleotide adenylyltransferase [Alteromonas sediminis]